MIVDRHSRVSLDPIVADAAATSRPLRSLRARGGERLRSTGVVLDRDDPPVTDAKDVEQLAAHIHAADLGEPPGTFAPSTAAPSAAISSTASAPRRPSLIPIPLLFAPPTSGGALLFYGGSMLLAAARRSGGCEVTVASNAILGRNDQFGGALFAPVEAAELLSRGAPPERRPHEPRDQLPQ